MMTDKIFDFIKQEYGININELFGNCRKQNIVDIRNILIDILYNDNGWTKKQIAEYFQKHRTTIIHSLQSSENMKKYNPEYLKLYNEIKRYER